MSIPIYRHRFRSERIEYDIFPPNRKHLFDRKYRKIEYYHTILIFTFWIFLYASSNIGFTCFMSMRTGNQYAGLKVVLPDSKNGKFIQQDPNGIYIFVDRNYQFVFNDVRLKKFSDLGSLLDEKKLIRKLPEVYLFIDRKCKMYLPKMILRYLNNAGFKRIHFMTGIQI